MLQKIFGDHPIATALKLIVLSIIAGIIMAAFNLNPKDLFNKIGRLFEKIWDMGWDSIAWGLDYFLLGAVIVIPIWIIMRLLNQTNNKDL